MTSEIARHMNARSVTISVGVALSGDLTIPADARGIVVFAHGSGSSRLSPRNQSVATYLQNHGFATLLFDLLTAAEEAVDRRTAEFRFDISMLAQRLVYATDWLATERDTRWLRVAYFGASTGAAAALIAAARRPPVVHAVVSRGGRPDLAGPALHHVTAPTLLIVGGLDEPVISMNRAALNELACKVKRLEIVPGATHLFEEPGTLDQVCELALGWFNRHLPVPQ
jgi:putative phosphoribosyl transferase